MQPSVSEVIVLLSGEKAVRRAGPPPGNQRVTLPCQHPKPDYSSLGPRGQRDPSAEAAIVQGTAHSEASLISCSRLRDPKCVQFRRRTRLQESCRQPQSSGSKSHLAAPEKHKPCAAFAHSQTTVCFQTRGRHTLAVWRENNVEDALKPSGRRSSGGRHACTIRPLPASHTSSSRRNCWMRMPEFCRRPERNCTIPLSAQNLMVPIRRWRWLVGDLRRGLFAPPPASVRDRGALAAAPPWTRGQPASRANGTKTSNQSARHNLVDRTQYPIVWDLPLATFFSFPGSGPGPNGYCAT